MVPLYAAWTADLGVGDFVRVSTLERRASAIFVIVMKWR
jgi:hypothetical protein